MKFHFVFFINICLWFLNTTGSIEIDTELCHTHEYFAFVEPADRSILHLVTIELKEDNKLVVWYKQIKPNNLKIKNGEISAGDWKNMLKVPLTEAEVQRHEGVVEWKASESYLLENSELTLKLRCIEEGNKKRVILKMVPVQKDKSFVELDLSHLPGKSLENNIVIFPSFLGKTMEVMIETVMDEPPLYIFFNMKVNFFSNTFRYPEVLFVNFSVQEYQILENQFKLIPRSSGIVTANAYMLSNGTLDFRSFSSPYYICVSMKISNTDLLEERIRFNFGHERVRVRLDKKPLEPNPERLEWLKNTFFTESTQKRAAVSPELIKYTYKTRFQKGEDVSIFDLFLSSYTFDVTEEEENKVNVIYLPVLIKNSALSINKIFEFNPIKFFFDRNSENIFQYFNFIVKRLEILFIISVKLVRKNDRTWEIDYDLEKTRLFFLETGSKVLESSFCRINSVEAIPLPESSILHLSWKTPILLFQDREMLFTDKVINSIPLLKKSQGTFFAYINLLDDISTVKTDCSTTLRRDIMEVFRYPYELFLQICYFSILKLAEEGSEYHIERLEEFKSKDGIKFLKNILYLARLEKRDICVALTENGDRREKFLKKVFSLKMFIELLLSLIDHSSILFNL